MRLVRKVAIFTIIALASLWQPQAIQAGRLNVEDQLGQVCRVTSMVDDVNISGSLRRAMETGYNVQDSSVPSFCKQKIIFDTPGTITLRKPIELNNQAAVNFVFEKSSGVAGEVVLDGSRLEEGSCAIILDSNQVTIRGITIRNAPSGGICIESGANRNIIENVTVTNSAHGIIVKSGSQNNTIQNSYFFDNTGFGVKLNDATQNRVTHNGLFRNGVGPIESPATNFQPELTNASPANQTASEWTLFGSVPTDIDHIEIYRGAPSGTTSNFITDITGTNALTFTATIAARAGEDIFAIGIAPDGTTSPASTFVRLSSIGGGGGGGTGTCVPGVPPPENQFFDQDGDGIFDIREDKNSNCICDPGESCFNQADTDGDGINDGLEDRNKNGIVDASETDPTLVDTDGDKIPDGVEDLNQNGIRDPNELNPTLADTDGDGLTDDREDLNKNGIKDSNETDGTLVDTDFDGLTDGEEDLNRDGIHDPIRESDPRRSDTDGDGLLDPNDKCPNKPISTCKVPCIPGVVPDLELDNDVDGIPDVEEDINSDCIVDLTETDPFLKDTDKDGLRDDRDPCPKSAMEGCTGVCNIEDIDIYHDSDGDGLFNIEEDIDADCLVDPLESDPFNPDTDNDGIFDGDDTCPLDNNPVCATPCRPGIEAPEGQDSDGDKIDDRDEDINNNCIKDENETSFKLRDTDGDGTNDNFDPCPNNDDQSCVKECVRGEFIPPGRDSDRDGIQDIDEDKNLNCIFDRGSETDSYNSDSDEDGLPDGVEDKNQNGILDEGETDPRNPDSDGDGLLDGVEDANANGVQDFDECNPLKQDTDDDGLLDFLEDTNKNGRLDAGETNCARADTDQDGLSDGEEDRNKNGILDAGETDPRNPDTDGDGANDGQEVQQGTNPINASSNDFNKALGKGCALTTGPVSAGFGFISVLGWILGLAALRFRRFKK